MVFQQQEDNAVIGLNIIHGLNIYILVSCEKLGR